MQAGEWDGLRQPIPLDSQLMKAAGFLKSPWFRPIAVATAGVALFAAWMLKDSGKPLSVRVPGTDRAPGGELGTNANAVLAGRLLRGEGIPATNLTGNWPQFRGPNLDLVSAEETRLLRSWQAGEPREYWGVEVGEGYAGPAVWNGRVYLMDYDREKKQDALRCFSLADGKEIWRYAYPVTVKRNHGMSRTVPVIASNHVIALGPKCHVVCLDTSTGELRWGFDLVQEHGTTVPQWYAGQTPLIEGDRVILAPGGPDALVMAAGLATGKPIWRTPNPRGWKMTHASLTPMEFEGERFYVYCADKGVVAASAKDGSVLWETTDWKISIATVPSPVVIGGGRVFFSGGYNAGSLMLQLKKDGNRIVPTVAWRLGPEVFGATQHTPILHQDHLYGVRPDGKFTCLTLDGKAVWVSSQGHQFGLGPFMIADGLIFAMNDSGLLRLIEASPARYNLLAQAQVLKGRESWGPLALAGGRLLARDFTRLVCLDVAQPLSVARP